jgi:hypothetical protein
MRRPHVVLLTAAPEMYTGLLNSLSSRGIPATAACSPEDASRLLDRRPLTLLVDLVHGPGLDDATVRKINQRGSGLVLALHAGEIGPSSGPLMDLSVDGYCHFDDWGAIASTTPPDGHTFALH